MSYYIAGCSTTGSTGCGGGALTLASIKSAIAKTELRNIAPGTRFVLCRTGERYRSTGRMVKNSRHRYVVFRERDGKETGLNHQCFVIPIVKPHIRLKSNVPYRKPQQ